MTNKKRTLWGRVFGAIGLSAVIFLCGFMVSGLVNEGSFPEVQNTEAFGVFNSYITKERISPADHITEDKIHVYKDHIYIDVAGASWGTFLDTNSMDPILDKGHNSIEIKPEDFTDVYIGDIIVYENQDYGYIIHRVVATGFDNEGWYAITKGDNNVVEDNWKVRFEQIEGIVIGIIY